MRKQFLLTKQTFMLISKVFVATYIYILIPFFIGMIITRSLSQRLFLLKLIISLLFSFLSVYYYWLRPIKDFKSLMRRVKLYIRIKRYKRAEDILDLYLRNNEVSTAQESDIILQIVTLSLLMGKMEQAECYIDKLLNTEIDDFQKGEKFYVIGICYLQNNNYSKAIYYFEKAFEIAFIYINKVHIHPDMLFEIVKVYVSMNRTQKAKEIYQTLLANKRIKKNKKVESLLNK